MSCGCVLDDPSLADNDHGDPRQITLSELAGAAAANDGTLAEVKAAIGASLEAIQQAPAAPVPGCEGSIGPFGDQEYCQPHVYARDVTSGAGNCVCGAALGDDLHTEAAPGVPVPDGQRAVCKAVALPAASGAPQRYVLGVAYQPGPDPRIAKGVDGGRDWFSEAELEKAAWSLLSGGGPRSGLFHIDGTDEGDGAARIVESYIYRNDEPWVISDDLVITKGTWLVGAILSPRAWDLYLSGRVGGLSPQGVARRRGIRKAAEPVKAAFAVTGPPDQIAAFAGLCQMIQWLCGVGASRTVQIDVDGDGAGALRFDLAGMDLPAVDESQVGDDVVRLPGIGT